MTSAAATALDDIEATAPEKVIGLLSPGKLIGIQEFACRNPVGKRNCVLRRKVFAVRDDAIISPPSSRWNPVPENAAQGRLDALLADEVWNHESLTVFCSQSCGLLNLPERVFDGKQCRTFWGDGRVGGAR